VPEISDREGAYQLTRIDKHITYFYYYNVRAEDHPGFEEFDSGLLEEQPDNVGEETYNGRAPGAPSDPATSL